MCQTETIKPVFAELQAVVTVAKSKLTTEPIVVTVAKPKATAGPIVLCSLSFLLNAVYLLSFPKAPSHVSRSTGQSRICFYSQHPS